jgi:hypothetical protein
MGVYAETSYTPSYASKGKSKGNMMRVCTYIVLALLLAGCAEDVQTTQDARANVPKRKIAKDQAVSIARRRLQDEPFAKEIDANRITTHYGTYGPKETARTCWGIDFARRGTGEVTPGQWEAGYQVVVDPDTGVIIEAIGYKR